MNNEKSRTLEILGMAMAALTVLIAAVMVLKHEFQTTAFADNSPQDATSVADAEQLAAVALPLRSQSEMMDGFSSVSNRAAADRIYRALEKPCPQLDFPRNTDLRDILEPIFDRLRQNEGESSIDGEGGRLNFHHELLIIRQSWRAHLAISDLLEQLAERIESPHVE